MHVKSVLGAASTVIQAALLLILMGLPGKRDCRLQLIFFARRTPIRLSVWSLRRWIHFLRNNFDADASVPAL